VGRERELTRVLVEFAHTLGTDFSIAQTLDHLVLRIVDALRVSGAGIMLMDADGELHFVAASNDSAREIESLQNELHEGPCLAAYLSGEPVAVPDVGNDEQFPRFCERASRRGIRAVFAFPLSLDGQRLGALDLYRDTPGELDAEDIAAAKTLADVAAAYLFNARVRSDARDSEQVLLHRSLHDPLTGLPNRTLLEERLAHASVRASGSERMAAVLFVDLDGFKAINDRFGHHCGDLLLKEVANRLSGALRPGDTLARLAGDEFVILCEDVTSLDQGEAVAKRVVDILSAPFPIGGHLLAVRASVGVAFSVRGEDIPKKLLRDADFAMYQAKREGGAQHRVLDRVTGAPEVGELPIWDILGDSKRALQNALEQEELRLAYQPIVNIADGSLRHLEALLRWEHPQRGWVKPQTIVASAERTGLIIPVGEWVLMRACQDLQAWRRQYAGAVLPDLTVNVSAHQVMSGRFTEVLDNVLSQTSIHPESLTLEVTESVFLIDEPRARAVLHELKEVGVGLALDDFGTGYSSLAYLRRFPFDLVKIDRAFIADIDRDASARAIVGAVIELAHALELSEVAEGVETRRQLAHVERLGGERAQGHYFSPPLLPPELQRRILRHAGPQPVQLPKRAVSVSLPST
jgi:diguanylate cyclase (GGDEF)-like protein